MATSQKTSETSKRRSKFCTPVQNLAVHELVEAPPGMRNPSWRFVVALDFTADLSKSLKPLSHDTYLSEACKHYRETKLQSIDPSHKYDPVYDIKWAFKVYTATGSTGLRWTIEALILGGMDDEAIANVTGLTNGIVKAFRNIFFDVAPYIGNRDKIYNCVLPMSHGKLNIYNSWDYTWKVFATEFGAGEFMKFRRNAVKELPPDALEWLKHQQAFKAMSMGSHAMEDARIAYTEEAQAIICTAMGYWKLLKEDMEDIPKSDVADQFFNKVIPQVQLVLAGAQKKSARREVTIPELIKNA